MYKNSSKCTHTLIWSILGLVFGIGPALFWSFILVMCIIDGNVDISAPIFGSVCLVLCVMFIVLSSRGFSALMTVSFCNRVFEGDPDGIVEMDSLLSVKGASKGSSFERRVLRAVERDYFDKLTYDRTYRVFELSDRVTNMEEYKTRFIGKNCPNCGAPLKIKKGLSVICDKCGREVRA